MTNVYTAKMSDGSAYEVPTEQHHDNHSEQSFKKHLLDVIKSSVAGVISGTVVHFAFKGRK